MPFVTEYRLSVPNLKRILMSNWHLIENQPLLRNIYKTPPPISYRKGRSLKDVFVRAKLWRTLFFISILTNRSPCLACQHHAPYVNVQLEPSLLQEVNQTTSEIPAQPPHCKPWKKRWIPRLPGRKNQVKIPGLPRVSPKWGVRGFQMTSV